MPSLCIAYTYLNVTLYHTNTCNDCVSIQNQGTFLEIQFLNERGSLGTFHTRENIFIYLDSWFQEF